MSRDVTRNTIMADMSCSCRRIFQHLLDFRSSDQPVSEMVMTTRSSSKGFAVPSASNPTQVVPEAVTSTGRNHDPNHASKCVQHDASGFLALNGYGSGCVPLGFFDPSQYQPDGVFDLESLLNTSDKVLGLEMEERNSGLVASSHALPANINTRNLTNRKSPSNNSSEGISKERRLRRSSRFSIPDFGNGVVDLTVDEVETFTPADHTPSPRRCSARLIQQRSGNDGSTGSSVSLELPYRYWCGEPNCSTSELDPAEIAAHYELMHSEKEYDPTKVVCCAFRPESPIPVMPLKQNLVRNIDTANLAPILQSIREQPHDPVRQLEQQLFPQLGQNIGHIPKLHTTSGTSRHELTQNQSDRSLQARSQSGHPERFLPMNNSQPESIPEPQRSTFRQRNQTAHTSRPIHSQQRPDRTQSQRPINQNHAPRDHKTTEQELLRRSFCENTRTLNKKSYFLPHPNYSSCSARSVQVLRPDTHKECLTTAKKNVESLMKELYRQLALRFILEGKESRELYKEATAFLDMRLHRTRSEWREGKNLPEVNLAIYPVQHDIAKHYEHSFHYQLFRFYLEVLKTQYDLDRPDPDNDRIWWLRSAERRKCCAIESWRWVFETANRIFNDHKQLNVGKIDKSLNTAEEHSNDLDDLDNSLREDGKLGGVGVPSRKRKGSGSYQNIHTQSKKLKPNTPLSEGPVPSLSLEQRKRIALVQSTDGKPGDRMTIEELEAFSTPEFVTYIRNQYSDERPELADWTDKEVTIWFETRKKPAHVRHVLTDTEKTRQQRLESGYREL